MTSRKQVVVIDSGGANLASLGFALERQDVDVIVTGNAKLIASAERVLLPGVGNAAAIMDRLNAQGLVPVIRALSCPVLGICLGMQLLFERSAEGNTAGLALLNGLVEPIAPAPGFPVPHMGWNTLRQRIDDPLLHNIDSNDWFYFVHGYHAPGSAPSVIATVEYGTSFAAVVRSANYRGVQFHPERSGAAGAKLIANFLEL